MRTPLPPTPASSPVIWSPPWTAAPPPGRTRVLWPPGSRATPAPGWSCLPAGRAEYTAVLTRRAITVPATYTELWDGHIGYIDCDTFGGETVAHFVSGMEDTAAGADHGSSISGATAAVR